MKIISTIIIAVIMLFSCRTITYVDTEHTYIETTNPQNSIDSITRFYNIFIPEYRDWSTVQMSTETTVITNFQYYIEIGNELYLFNVIDKESDSLDIVKFRLEREINVEKKKRK